MVANAEMLYAGVPSLILGKLTRGVVIAIEGGGVKNRHVEAIQELTEE
jgi:hypothetical protein